MTRRRWFPKNISSGNPYAAIADDEHDVPTPQQLGLAFPEIGTCPQRDAGELRKVTLRFFDYPSGNPYVFIGDETEPEDKVDIAPASVMMFTARCRSIFASYVPVQERRTLRPHQREFISRNVRRSPKARGRILRALERYDLSKLGNVTAQFNRERDPFTVAKLMDIEAQADE